MPDLRRLQRDELWIHNAERPQLEFVIDNETVANHMNLEAKVDSDFYEPMITRMRQNVYKAFTETFEYKGGFLSCHEWRPREYNSQADAVCNWVLDERSDMDELDVQIVVSRLASGQMLQVYSDGGFDGVCGAASFVLVFNTFEGGVWHASTGGYRGVYISNARSAYQAELIGADAAISFAIELGRELRRRHTCN